MNAALRRFNALSHHQAIRVLEGCAAVPRWADEIAWGRPYHDVDQVLTAARTAAEPWTDVEIDAALAHHPRIGDRPQARDAQSAHSRREQSGVDATDAEVARRLLAGNWAYEEKFGHVFLIRAAGRSATDILAALRQRLGNDPDTERSITAQQLREIAFLRLEQELT